MTLDYRVLVRRRLLNSQLFPAAPGQATNYRTRTGTAPGTCTVPVE